MSNHKVIRRFVTLCSAVCISLAIMSSPIASMPVQAIGAQEEIQPLSDKIEWRFKIENNKIYKRLYNYSIGDWVGEWIYVRDLP